MKRLFKILVVFLSSILMLFALAFIFIEGRLLFSGDWLVYDSPLMGFIRYLCRLLIAVLVFSKSILEIININKAKPIKEYLYYCDIAYVLIAICVIAFSANYVGIICIALAVVNLAIKFFGNSVFETK